LQGNPDYQVIPLMSLNRMARDNGQANPLVAFAAPREQRTPAQIEAEQYFSLADGRLIIYPVHRDILLGDEMIRPKFALFRGLALLAAHADSPVGKEAIAASMHSDRTTRFNPTTLKTYMKRMRALLGDLGNPETGVIRAVRGVGYMALSSLEGMSGTDSAV
jgi:DNA-binding response OmpR family regulator